MADKPKWTRLGNRWTWSTHSYDAPHALAMSVTEDPCDEIPGWKPFAWGARYKDGYLSGRSVSFRGAKRAARRALDDIYLRGRGTQYNRRRGHA